jgi:hypothetical protein
MRVAIPYAATFLLELVEFAARYRFTPAAFDTITLPVPFEIILIADPILKPTVLFAGTVIVCVPAVFCV